MRQRARGGDASGNAETAGTRRGSPLYVQLAAVFRRLITRNVWPVGSQVARLESLAAEYGVARITVRQAMDLLEQEGLVSRARGRGTHVLKLPPAARWIRMQAAWDEFIWPTATAHTRVLEDFPARGLPDLAPHEGRLKGPYRFLKVITYRSADGPPIAVRTTYLRASIYRKVKSKIASSLYLALLAEFAERLTVFNEIGSASADVAVALQIPPGSPVVEARHVAVDAEGLVAYVDFPIVRGDFMKFEINIQRSGRPAPRTCATSV